MSEIDWKERALAAEERLATLLDAAETCCCNEPPDLDTLEVAVADLGSAAAAYRRRVEASVLDAMADDVEARGRSLNESHADGGECFALAEHLRAEAERRKE